MIKWYCAFTTPSTHFLCTRVLWKPKRRFFCISTTPLKSHWGQCIFRFRIFKTLGLRMRSSSAFTLLTIWPTPTILADHLQILVEFLSLHFLGPYGKTSAITWESNDSTKDVEVFPTQWFTYFKHAVFNPTCKYTLTKISSWIMCQFW